MDDLRQRRGMFDVTTEQMFNEPDLVMDIMGHCIVTKVVYDDIFDRRRYTAISPLFDRVPDNCKPCLYPFSAVEARIDKNPQMLELKPELGKPCDTMVEYTDAKQGPAITHYKDGSLAINGEHITAHWVDHYNEHGWPERFGC